MSKDLATSVPNGSLVRSIQDMMDCSLGVHDAFKVERLRTRLAQLGQAEMGSRIASARKAEVIYNIQAEEDWKQLINADTDRPFQIWSEFRVKLKEMFAVGLGTIGDYLRTVRFARGVLDIEDGDLPMVGGLVTVRSVMELCTGIDARSTEDIAQTVRPVTEEAKAALLKYYGDAVEPSTPAEEIQWKPMVKAIFDERYRHDLKDPLAINKPPSELYQQSRDITGRPRVTYEWNGDGKVIKWSLEYAPHTDGDGGTTEIRDSDSGTLRLEDFVPAPVREDLARKLRLG